VLFQNRATFCEVIKKHRMPFEEEFQDYVVAKSIISKASPNDVFRVFLLTEIEARLVQKLESVQVVNNIVRASDGLLHVIHSEKVSILGWHGAGSVEGNSHYG